jgi:predicted transcriptional regulator
MKSLIVTLKTSTEALDDFKNALKLARKGKLKENHYEVSFDNKKDFERFVKNIYLLSMIITYKPRSIYELAKLCNLDVSNLNKIILFFEEFGVLTLREMKVGGRNVKKPIVEYDKIEFNLVA